jgi:hypothetical protein
MREKDDELRRWKQQATMKGNELDECRYELRQAKHAEQYYRDVALIRMYRDMETLIARLHRAQGFIMGVRQDFAELAESGELPDFMQSCTHEFSDPRRYVERFENRAPGYDMSADTAIRTPKDRFDD